MSFETYIEKGWDIREPMTPDQIRVRHKKVEHCGEEQESQELWQWNTWWQRVTVRKRTWHQWLLWLFVLWISAPNFDDGGCCNNGGGFELGMALSTCVSI
jgi:hypothetical protein